MSFGFAVYSWLLDRWFSVFVKYLLYNSLVCYLRRIYTFIKLSGPKTSFFLLWCLVLWLSTNFYIYLLLFSWYVEWTFCGGVPESVGVSCGGESESDEERESIESLKNESAKLGNPHFEHIHVRDELPRTSYICKSVASHFAWNQTSHISHWIPFW